MRKRTRKNRSVKFVLLGHGTYLVTCVKALLKTYCAWPTSIKGKQTCTHGMSCKRNYALQHYLLYIYIYIYIYECTF